MLSAESVSFQKCACVSWANVFRRTASSEAPAIPWRDAGALPGDGRDPLQLENGRSEFFRDPMVLAFEAAYVPVKLFVFAEDPADLLESAGALMHTSLFQKGRRRAELGERRMYHVPGFVTELVGATAGAPVRNQGFAGQTNPPVPGARGSVPWVKVDFGLL